MPNEAAGHRAALPHRAARGKPGIILSGPVTPRPPDPATPTIPLPRPGPSSQMSHVKWQPCVLHVDEPDRRLMDSRATSGDAPASLHCGPSGLRTYGRILG
ncbi:hypothetical protein Bbelb_029480 [Branchiostoma belcheri]|nr:hypothetical protein Bbelb_029480 [Branchiostoma belcheri]